MAAENVVGVLMKGAIVETIYCQKISGYSWPGAVGSHGEEHEVSRVVMVSIMQA